MNLPRLRPPLIFGLAGLAALVPIRASSPQDDVASPVADRPSAFPDAPGPAGPDTTFTLPAGARLVIVNPDGDIEVRGRSGRDVRVRVDGEEHAARVTRQGSVFRIEPFEGYRSGDDVVILAPRDAGLTVEGQDGDITISGFESGVVVETLDGDIAVDGAGAVSTHSVDGDVRLRDVGAVTVNSGDGDIVIDGAAGPVSVRGIDGDVVVRNAGSGEVDLSMVTGDLWFEGPVRAGGSYSLATHDGDVTFALPEGIGGRFSILTYDGALIPSFPLELRGSLGSIAEFTVGDGSASIQLESFDGDIHLIRPGERVPDDR